MFWFIMVAGVFALYCIALFWPQKNDSIAYPNPDQQRQHEWCNAFAKRVLERRKDISFDQAWAAACGSYPVMQHQDPRQSADVEISYWD